MALRTVGVRLTAEISDYQRKLRQASKETTDFVGEMSKAAKGGHLDAVADQAGVAGLALGGLAAGAVKLSMDFEKSMSAVSAATHANAQDMEKMRQAALQAGKDTQYSATQAADAITELSKAGVSTSAVLNGALDGALDLAAAGQLDVAEAAETAASAMTQFKLSGNQVPHIADLLAAGAGKAQGSVHDLGFALNQSGLVASQFGLSIEDTTGALAQFANAGLIGSDAGTSFKTMLLAIANPSGTTAKKMQELGISFYDAQGRFIGLSGVADELRDKLGQLTEEQRNAAMGQIFGSDAIRAATILYKDGSKGVEEWKSKVNQAGYAADTAAKLTDNLAGDIERLKGSLETAAIESGGGLNQGLRVLTQSADALVGEIDKIPGGVSTTLTVLAALGGALGLGLAAWIKTRAAIAAAVVELNAVGPAGAKAAAGLQATTKWAGRAAVAFVGLEVAGAVFDKLGNAAVNVDKLTAALQDYATTGKMTQGLTDEFGENLDDLALIAQSAEAATHGFWGALNDLTSSIPGVSSAVDSMNESLFGSSFNDATERMQGLDEAFSKFISTQTDAKRASEIWNEILSKSGLETEQLAKLLPNAWKGMQDLQAKSHGAAGAVGEVGDAAEESSGQVLALSESIDKLFQTQLSADRAAIKLAKSTGDLTAELTKGTRTLNINTDEGRRNRDAVLDQLEAIESVRDARVRGGMVLDEANKKYEKDITGLKKIMTQAGFTKAEIDNLVGAYEDIPGQVTSKISATGDKAVTVTLDDMLVKQRALQLGITPQQARGQVQKDLDRNRQGRYAAGGWTGPGGTYDEAGVVHADEYVIKKASRRKIEAAAPGLLDEMNATGTVPGYAGGGRVTWPYPVNVAKTKIPEVAAAGPTGGHVSDWIVATARALVPGIRVLSKDRPGAVTLTGNRSYHALGRAVDFEPSRRLAELWNERYMGATKELISPWQSLNIHNGARHSYSPLVYNQHNFRGGNPHDHIAMRHGGTITEPIFGVGASGRTYSFGEGWQPERVVPGAGGGQAATVVNVTVHAPVGSSPREIGREVATVLESYCRGGGRVELRGSVTT